jgi:hypothetical protein
MGEIGDSILPNSTGKFLKKSPLISLKSSTSFVAQDRTTMQRQRYGTPKVWNAKGIKN